MTNKAVELVAVGQWVFARDESGGVWRMDTNPQSMNHEWEAVPLPARCADNHMCACGGKGSLHVIGADGCFREMTASPTPAGKHAELGCDTWIMPDEDGAITDFTLRQQRGYHRYECGCWSKSSAGSSNSIDA